MRKATDAGKADVLRRCISRRANQGEKKLLSQRLVTQKVWLSNQLFLGGQAGWLPPRS